jgi:hypothetical protein
MMAGPEIISSVPRSGQMVLVKPIVAIQVNLNAPFLSTSQLPAYAMGIGESLPGIKLLECEVDHLHRVLTSRMSGAILRLPHIPS